jgi:phytoene dehydrogenase-like protein
MSEPWDVIVVGGGHNGLACAGYLGKAGQRVLVLETREVAGGGCATEQVTVPGFTHNLNSNFHGLIHWGPVYRELELERHGARYVWPENQFAHVFPDGRALVCSLSLKETIKSIERFSRRDARVFAQLARSYREALEEAIIPSLFAPPRPPSQEFAAMEESVEGLRELWGAFTTPDHLSRELFESPEVQTWIGFWVAQLAGTGDMFGLGANYPVMLAGSLEPFGWALAVGGSQTLAQAMVRFVEEHGGQVRVGANVRQIEVQGARAVAVRLDDGERIEGRTIVSNLDPRVTFLEMVGEGELDGTFARAVRRWRYDSISMFCVYLALERPVQWHAAEFEPKVARCFAVSMCDDLQQLEDSASDCRLGRTPRTPGLFSVHPSLFEPQLAPAGKEACFVEQIAPYELREDDWDDRREPYAETVLSRWSEYASGLEAENVLGRYISGPVDIERVTPSMRRGDWNHGEMSQDQMGIFRPFFEYPPYRTAFENVYLCGASTHPGGSISGACGRNAAGAICEDLAIERWWGEVYA